jgi:hypothetical protein
MIAFRDPPPLEVRVPSLQEAMEAPPTHDAPVKEWLIGLLLLFAGAVYAASQRADVSAQQALVSALSNSLPRETERAILAVLPIGTPERDVLRMLGESKATCRTPGNGTHICLGLPVVRANTFTRQRIDFTFRDAKLSRVAACPTFVHWARTPVPNALASRVIAARGNGCWRDATNQADNEWAFATLPDSAFTTVTVNGAERVSRTTTATHDTLLVFW